jgi:hypothetical protein
MNVEQNEEQTDMKPNKQIQLNSTNNPSGPGDQVCTNQNNKPNLHFDFR